MDVNTASVALFWMTAMTCLNSKDVKAKEIKVFDESLEYDVNIIYKKDKDMDTSVKEFIDFLKKVGEKSFC